MQKKLILEFVMENAAFADGNCDIEAARILRALADRIEQRGVNDADDHVIRDINGNKVGKVIVYAGSDE